MKKSCLIIFSTVILFSVLSVLGVNHFILKNKNVNSIKKEQTSNTKVKINNTIENEQENQEEFVNKNEEIKENENTEEKTTIKENESTNTTKTTNNNNNKPVIKTEIKKETIPVIEVAPEEIVKEPTEWERLGITEYEYYNSPMWKWATVDFSVDKLGSKEKAKQSCIKKAERIFNPCIDDDGKLIPNCDIEPISGSYTCYEVNSYSGRFLGYYLKIQKLID